MQANNGGSNSPQLTLPNAFKSPMKRVNLPMEFNSGGVERLNLRTSIINSPMVLSPINKGLQTLNGPGSLGKTFNLMNKTAQL